MLTNDRRQPIRLEPWHEADLVLLRKINTPAMKRHVGGAETEDQLRRRHQRYLEMARTGTGRMFRVHLPDPPDPAGTVGYKSRVWRGEAVFEMGWNVLPPFQGRGIATAAVLAAVALLAAERRHRHAYAFPAVDNAASNAVCRRAGFALVEQCDFEYPPGSVMRSNSWRFDLSAA
jgi:RimJ/RimL family protein N-acetyltransferase